MNSGYERVGMAEASKVSETYRVSSEVGKLHKVLVCAPGLAHDRLTPTNCDDLLFDDVLWVQNARRDHFDFMVKMRDRGVEVVELHNVLTEIWTSRRLARGCWIARSPPARWDLVWSMRPGPTWTA
jgi:arginine deiminase